MPPLSTYRKLALRIARAVNKFVHHSTDPSDHELANVIEPHLTAAAADRARLASEKRKVHAGGRPVSADRCACRKYTVATAEKRGHKC